MAVYVSHINKSFGQQEVLKDISFSIADGEVVGLLGPNGAGKSTLMKILLGRLQPTTAKIAPIINVPDTHGYLPEQNPLYPDMYVREYLLYMSRLEFLSHPLQRVEQLIKDVGLEPEAHKRIGELSKGYRQRVGIAQALLGDPELLILDEPTTGLDPNQLEEIRTLIKHIGESRTVILSTHILQEVREMCSRVLLLHHGQLRVDSPIDKINDLEQLFHDMTQSI